MLPWLNQLVARLTAAFKQVAGQEPEDWLGPYGLVQGGAIASTASYAEYQISGGWCSVEAVLVAGGAGVGNNPIRLGVPVSPAYIAGQTVGDGYLYDASVGVRYPFQVIATAANQFSFIEGPNPGVGVLIGQTGSSFNLALANTDTFVLHLHYRCVV